MIRLRIDRSLESDDDWQGLVWAEKEGRRTKMYPVIIEQTTVVSDGAHEVGIEWAPVEVVDNPRPVSKAIYDAYLGSSDNPPPPTDKQFADLLQDHLDGVRDSVLR